MTTDRLGRIEKLPCGKAILHYPGRESRTYSSPNVAATRRWQIEIDRRREKPANRFGKAWTAEEKKMLREFWGQLPKEEYERRLPGRTYEAIQAYCWRSGIEADPDLIRRRHIECLQQGKRFVATLWTPEQVRILAENPRDVARQLLKGQKTAVQLQRMSKRLGLQIKGEPRPYSTEEMNHIKSIERAMKALKERYGRTANSIDARRAKYRSSEQQMSDTLSAIKVAVTHLSAEVRLDVEGEVLVQVLAREIKLADVPAAVRKAVTKIYGPRHYSLDAPLSDGSGMNWIDTIADDRAHF